MTLRRRAHETPRLPRAMPGGLRSLGTPSSTGGQNDVRYAYFPQSQRLAILQDGKIRLYDTLDHHIGGVQQQQGGSSGTLTFSSQHGSFSVDTLPLLRPASERPLVKSAPVPSHEAQEPAPAPTLRQGSVGSHSHDDILKTLEGLSDLHQKGILSDEEFKSKKAELLSRL